MPLMKKTKLIMESWRKYLQEEVDTHREWDPVRDGDMVDRAPDSPKEAPEEMDQEFEIMKKIEKGAKKGLSKYNSARRKWNDAATSARKRLGREFESRTDFQKHLDADSPEYHKQAKKAADAHETRKQAKKAPAAHETGK